MSMTSVKEALDAIENSPFQKIEEEQPLRKSSLSASHFTLRFAPI